MDTINTLEKPKVWLTKERAIWLGICLVLFSAALGLLIWLVLACLPAPRFTEFPGTTNQEKVSLKGLAGPNLGVVLFDKDKKAIASVNADEKGNFIFENVVLADGENKFFARALDMRKKSSKPSEEIIVGRDANAPDLLVEAPEGATVTSKDYAVIGKAEPGSKVVVNGVTAEVGADGTWSATVPLNPGTNFLTVTATDAEGNEASTTTEVTYTPPAGEGANVNSGAGTNINEPAAGTGEANANTNTDAAANTNTNTNANTNTAPPPPPETASSISVTASVSNQTPNVKSNETISAAVKDNLGNAVTGATVRAVAHYKAGNVTYNLAHLGGGNYSVSFKIGTGSESGYKVLVDVTASFEGKTASTQVSFTPR